MKPIFTIYIVIVILGIFIYLYNLVILNRNKKRIGEVYGKWSLTFNLKNRINWIIWAIVIAYLILSIYFIFSKPHKDNDFVFLVLFIIFLSFYPTWNIRVGSEGIILGSTMIPNERLVEKRIIDKRKSKYLFLKWTPDSTSPRTKTTKILIPLKNFDIEEKHSS